MNPLLIPSLELSEFEQCEPGYILARCEIFGVSHHVEFIRVEDDEDGGQQAWGDGYNCNDIRYERLLAIVDAKMETVRLPGYDGEWVCQITPFGV